VDNYNQQEFARKLLYSSTLDHELQERIEYWIDDCEDIELLAKLIAKLKNNQLDPITSGLNYTSKDITEHFKKIL
jgi:hypothetical protein